MGRFLPKRLVLFFLFVSQVAVAQTYRTNGSATQDNCNCYTLTTETMNQSGSVWNATQTDLRQPFDFKFNVFLGCNDGGADGIAFILQTQSTSVGRSGSGLGFAGVSPSIGIALDTYQNTFIGSPIDDLNDPPFDHISIQRDGAVRHGTDLAEPVTASATGNNIEDCNWHVLRITWAPDQKKLDAYFDGVFRVGVTVDLVGDVFRSSPLVYWGFSASTGGSVNQQKFCTALNPNFTTNVESDGACIGTPLVFTDQSLSFTTIASYYWEFGDGTNSTGAAPPEHRYTVPGAYPVRLAITGLDGCKSDTIQKEIIIGSVPNAAFSIADACLKKAPDIRFQNSNFGTANQWLVDGAEVSTEEQPLLTTLPAGQHTIKRTVVSKFGCGVDVASQPVTIKPIPVVEATVAADACASVPVLFKGVSQETGTVIQEWSWAFGDAQNAAVQNTTHAYKRAGAYTATLWALAANGCSSDTVSKAVTVHQAQANAGRDTIVLNSVPFHLAGSGNGAAAWLPATGLNRADIFDPAGTLANDQQYELTVTTPEGCVAKDSVRIEVFKGSAVYMPTAFSPNGNGLNDVLRPQYVGMKKLRYFTIYNRWGELLFSTTDLSAGWDGRQNGKPAATGSFVWMLEAEDIVGHVYTLKGTFVLIH